MVPFFTTFAEAASSAEHAGEQADLLTALGINWQLLLVQIAAFLLLVWLLGKFVYPWLMKSVDQRQADAEAAAKASKLAQEKAEQSQEETSKLLAEARKEAAEIVLTAKEEATDMLASSEKRARKNADRIVAEARDQLQKDVDAARRALHDETLELVALATEKVVAKKHDLKDDSELIASLIRDGR